jgi:hypothetical protein
MKALHDRTQNLHGQGVTANLAARVAAIFEQYPILCGFSVQEHSMVTEDRIKVPLPGALCLADVSVVTPPELRVTQAFCEHIADMLAELMDEQPDVFDLLSGRTFARTFH